MKINIDAGHGSNTAGKRTPPLPHDIPAVGIKKGEQYREHYANVGVAFLLEQELRRNGFEIHKTGWNDANADDDPDIPLTDRQRAVALAGCDYSISIHFNAHGNGTEFTPAEGIEVLIHDKFLGQSEKLAQTVLKHLTQGSKQNNRGVKKQALAMCNCNNLDVKGAILVELAFMTSLREATELMANPEYWRESAQEIAQGLCEYTGIKYIPERKMPAKTITPESPADDVKWAQERLNAVIPAWLPQLKVDGQYGPKTRIAVLTYWEQLGWASHMRDDGTRIGTATREALASGRAR